MLLISVVILQLLLVREQFFSIVQLLVNIYFFHQGFRNAHRHIQKKLEERANTDSHGTSLGSSHGSILVDKDVFHQSSLFRQLLS